MSYSIAGLALLSSLALAARPAGHEVELAEPVVNVSVNLSKSHLGLEVTLGHEGPFWFNLDTYAVTTACIDSEFAKQMGYEKVGTTRNGDGSGEWRTLDVVLIPELRLGGATFTNVRALTDDYSWVEGPDGEPVKGLLGYHLFRDLLLELDYHNERVVLQRGELLSEDEHVIEYEALTESPDIPIHIGDREVVVGIDSGAQSALSLPYSLLKDLELLDDPVKAGRARTVYSSAIVWAGELKRELQFAGQRHINERATFSELFGKPLFGHALLKKYSITFDQKNGRVRFLNAEQVRVRIAGSGASSD